MAATKAFAKTLLHLKKNGLSLDATVFDDSVKIGSVYLSKASSPLDFQDASPTGGALLSHSSKKLRESLRAKGINYLDLNGNIFLRLSSHEILLEETKTKRRVARLNKKSDSKSPSATTLISPNALAFIDTIFRTKNSELENFRSTLQFCKAFDLYQPKASQIMRSLRAHNLIDLKDKLQNIPIEWWVFAFETKTTKRKMTSFFDVAQNYYSLDKTLDSLSTKDLFKKIQQQYGDDVAIGPLEVTKKLGMIQDNDFSLWVSPIRSSQIKKDFKLVAGTKTDQRVWALSSPPFDLKKEELISHVSNSDPILNTNLMRVAWDLSYGDSRLREIQPDILRKLIHGL